MPVRSPALLRVALVFIPFLVPCLARAADPIAAATKDVDTNTQQLQTLKSPSGIANAHLRRARAYLILQKYDDAIADFGKVIEIHPKLLAGYMGRIEANYELFCAAHDEKYRVAILADCNAAEKANANSGFPNLYRGLLLFQAGDCDNALKILLQAADALKGPPLHLARQSIADVLCAQSKWDEAYKYWNQLTFGGDKDPIDFFGLGDTLSHLSRPDEAIKAYQQALKLGATNVGEIQQRLGHLFLIQNNPDRAVDAYTEALSALGDSANLYLLRGEARAQSKLIPHAQAISDFDHALSLDPKLARAHFDKADLLAADGQFDPALADYSTGLQLQPEFLPVYLARAAVYVKLNQPAKAADDLTQAIRLNPKQPGLYLSRGAILAQLDRKKDALADYNKAVELGNRDVATFVSLSELNLALHNTSDAVKNLETALSIQPDDAPLQLKLAAACDADRQPIPAARHRALANFHLGHYADALPDMDRVLKASPDSPDMHSLYGQAELELASHEKPGSDAQRNRLDRAVEHFTQTVRIKPTDADAFSGRGQAYLTLSDSCKQNYFSKAATDLEHALSLRPSPTDNYRLALAYTALNNPTGAIDQYTKAINAGYHTWQIYANRADLEYNRNLINDAYVDYEQATNLHATTPDPYYGLALCCEAGADLNRALININEAIKLSPTPQARFYFRRGIITVKYGQEDPADFQRAAQLEPSNKQYADTAKNPPLTSSQKAERFIAGAITIMAVGAALQAMDDHHSAHQSDSTGPQAKGKSLGEGLAEESQRELDYSRAQQAQEDARFQREEQQRYQEQQREQMKRYYSDRGLSY